MKVVFRADASLEIGTGHVRRCLTLAQALREKGAQCRFICREFPGHLIDTLRQRGFEVLSLPYRPDWQASEREPAHAAWLGADWKTDAEQTLAAIGGEAVDWLIVDHYGIDARWEAALRPLAKKILVIDDLADRPHDCDLLLDQNLVADMERRYDGRLPEHCGRLLGPEYALLQPQYAELHPRVPPREGPINRLLIYFGGADADNLTGMTLAAFARLGRDDIALDVVINPTGPHAEAIRRQAAGCAWITLHEDLPSLAPLLVKADLAIGAGGATSWERCCLGLPALVVTIAENQKAIAKELDRQGLIRWLGHKDEIDAAALAEALAGILDTGLAPEWSERCRRLVDGRGVERVAGFLTLGPQTTLKARRARLDDEAMILRWANDPVTRRNAFNPARIDAATHHAWFRQKLRDIENCRLYVIETDAGLPIGQVRFERDEDVWEIHYAIDPYARQRRLGKPLLEAALLALRKEVKGALLLGRVKEDNLPSRRVFESLGFAAKDRGGGRLSIAVCSDATSWINVWVPDLLLGWLAEGHAVAWAHAAEDLPGGDLCFYLSYGKIVEAATRARYRNNLVVHASALPKGRGWSPASWLILEGTDRIPVTLFEAVDEVDAGPIYLQEWIDLEGAELLGEWHAKLAATTTILARRFVAGYPALLGQAREQAGEPSYYPRRRPSDSELSMDKTLAEQFNLLRIVDNESYPAFFRHKGGKFAIKVYRAS